MLKIRENSNCCSQEGVWIKCTCRLIFQPVYWVVQKSTNRKFGSNSTPCIVWPELSSLYCQYLNASFNHKNIYISGLLSILLIVLLMEVCMMFKIYISERWLDRSMKEWIFRSIFQEKSLEFYKYFDRLYSLHLSNESTKQVRYAHITK